MTQHGVCQHVVPQQVVVVGQGVHQAVMGDSVGRMVWIVTILNILLSGVHVIHQVFRHKMIIKISFTPHVSKYNNHFTIPINPHSCHQSNLFIKLTNITFRFKKITLTVQRP